MNHDYPNNVNLFYRNISIEELKSNLEDMIDDFINVNFTLHPKAISATANKRIRSGDVILTYSYSKLVERVLLDAWESGKKIKVIVADGRVQSLGRSLADNLVRAGIHTTYLLLTAASQVRPQHHPSSLHNDAPQVLAGVTRVILGCDGVMANGCVLATVGTSQVIRGEVTFLAPKGAYEVQMWSLCPSVCLSVHLSV